MHMYRKSRYNENVPRSMAAIDQDIVLVKQLIQAERSLQG
jgi:hypothetical protein